MKTLGVIPARYGSTRFPGKMIVPLAGKPLIQHTYEKVTSSSTLDEVLIATDDKRIFETVKKFGGKVVLTSADFQSGTDRVAFVAKNKNYDVVVNIQGDEPLLDPEIIDELVKLMKKDKSVVMATAVRKFKDSESLQDPNRVKVILDKELNALSFFRNSVPSNKLDSKSVHSKTDFFEHIGIYAFRKDFLLLFSKLPPGKMEKLENLEQLRAIENGYKIKVVLTDYVSHPVDTKEDLKKVEKILANKKLTEYVKTD